MVDAVAAPEMLIAIDEKRRAEDAFIQCRVDLGAKPRLDGVVL